MFNKGFRQRYDEGFCRLAYYDEGLIRVLYRVYDNGSRGVECRCKKSPSDAVNQSLWILLSSAGNWWTGIGRGSYEWKKGLNYRDKACSEEACNLVAIFLCENEGSTVMTGSG